MSDNLFQAQLEEVAEVPASDDSMRRVVGLLSQEVLKLTKLMQTFTENQIRQEGEKRLQEDFNERMEQQVAELKAEIKTLREELLAIRLKRAEESKGMSILSNYWWVILLCGLVIITQFPKAVSVLPTKG